MKYFLEIYSGSGESAKFLGSLVSDKKPVSGDVLTCNGIWSIRIALLFYGTHYIVYVE